MEALATLALVCNITQLVEQGISLAQLYKDVRKAGSSIENVRLQELMAMATAVDEERITLNSPQPLNSLDSQIKDVALKTVAASRKLEQCLCRLRYKDDAGKVARGPADIFLRSLWKKSNIAELYKEYEGLQQVLQTSLLRNVNNVLVQIQDDQTQSLIKVIETNDSVRKLLDGDCRLAASALSALNNFKQSHERSIQQLAKKMEDLALDERQRSARDRLLKCLDFEGRLDRVDQIEARVGQYHETAKWIFIDPDMEAASNSDSEREITSDSGISDDDPRVDSLDDEYGDGGGNGDEDDDDGEDDDVDDVEDDRTRSDGLYPYPYYEEQHARMAEVRHLFMDWLQNGTRIFYVSGKAGSGKSSIMAYIYGEMRPLVAWPTIISYTGALVYHSLCSVSSSSIHRRINS